MPEVSRIRTERLLMRRWRATGREPFAAMNADPHVMCYFPATLDRDASDRLVERIGLVRHGFFEHPLVPEGHPTRPHVAYRSPRRE